MRDLFYNPGLFGDIIYSIPFCLSSVGTTKQEDLGKKQFTMLLDLCLVHKERGADEALRSLNMVADLLRTQTYIKEVRTAHCIDWTGALDLGIIRKGKVSMDKGDIVLRYRFLDRQLEYYDNEDPWIVLPKDVRYDTFKNKIVIFRSDRYLNDRVNYKVLKPWEKNLVYIGYLEEYNRFCASSGLKPEFYKINNFIEMAQILNHCAFVIGNQTFFYSVAEAMKVPRLLEMSTKLPDVIPKGKFGNDFVDNDDLVALMHKYFGNFVK